MFNFKVEKFAVPTKINIFHVYAENDQYFDESSLWFLLRQFSQVIVE